MTLRPGADSTAPVVRSLAVGSALLSVATLLFTVASGWPLGRAMAYAVGVPLAASVGAAVVLAGAFASASLHVSDRVARGRFAMPVAAAAAGCVLASLWLVAPTDLAPARDQPAQPGTVTAAAPAGELAVAPPVRTSETGARTPVARTGRTARTTRTGATAPTTVRPDGDRGTAPVTPPFVGPVLGPVDPPAVAPPAAAPPRARPAPRLVDRTGVDPAEPDPDGAEADQGRPEPRAKTLSPGLRCGRRADHCGTPHGRGRARRVGWASRR